MVPFIGFLVFGFTSLDMASCWCSACSLPGLSPSRRDYSSPYYGSLGQTWNMFFFFFTGVL